MFNLPAGRQALNTQVNALTAEDFNYKRRQHGNKEPI